MSEPFIGQITLFPYTFAPVNWADCLGQTLPVAQYSALFSLLGTTFGGNGTTTFGLPNLDGRAAVGVGSLMGGGTYRMGEMGGAATVTLDPSTMPSHAHSLNATQAEGTVNTPANNLPATVFKGDFGAGAQGDVYSPSPTDNTLTPATLDLAGGGREHPNIQPSVVLRYCIALSGVYPARP